MPTLKGEQAAVTINVLGRHIPEGINSWENNWLEAEFLLATHDHNMQFCTRRLTVHDIYDLYFHLGIILAGLSPTGVFVPILQRQFHLKITPESAGFHISVAMPGYDGLEFSAPRDALGTFAKELREVLDAFPLRADEVPSVAPVIEFYSTKQKPDRLQVPPGPFARLRSLFKVANPLGQGWGDAIRFTFTLSKPAGRVGREVVQDFFAARDYRVEWNGDVLKAFRGKNGLWWGLDGKRLPTQVEFTPTDTHGILTIDVWTAGVRQSSLRLFAWVGEAAMLEVLLAGNKTLDFVRERLAHMDSNLRRANMYDLFRAVVVALGLVTILMLTL